MALAIKKKKSKDNALAERGTSYVNRAIIVHPLITEKASRCGEIGTYIFRVVDHAPKPEIKKAVEAIYDVTVCRVRVVNVRPKQRRLGRSIGTKSGYRKAFVTLAEGQKLDILPQ